MKTKKFWNFTKNEDESKKDEVRTLRIEGVIAEDGWFDDEVTPKMFKEELHAENGNIDLWIHSSGGDVIAAAQIYNMLKNYSGKITVKIDGLAASAASVIAMCGDTVLISPVGNLMVHDPITTAVGGAEEMNKAISMLQEIKESIINAYVLKTKLSRSKISKMMTQETWMNAKKAVELGFADDILFKDTYPRREFEAQKASMFSQTQIQGNILNQILKSTQEEKPKIKTESLYRRLNLLRK